MFERIVCATDFSPSATNAVHYAASIARTFGSQLELVHAWTPFDELDEYALLRPGALEEWKQKRSAKLTALVAEWNARGVRATGKLIEGEAHRVIVAHANEERADVLVTGTEGRRGIAHALLGSVAERILRTSDVPVLAVPRSWTVSDHGRFAPESILVPVDLEPLSSDMVKTATDLARKTPARITVAHAWDSPLLEPDGPTASAATTQIQSRFGRWMELNAPVTTPKVEWIVQRGAAFDLIEQVCEEREVDLIVMATAGRSGVEHFMLGSATERVLRMLARPVLTQRRARSDG